MRKGSSLVAMLLGSSACLALSAPAWGQDTESADVAAPNDEAVTAAPDTQDIIVTGSRIQTGNSSPTPVTVVRADALQAVSPATIADGLNKLPQFIGSNSQTTNGNPSSNGVGNFLNLRGLGTTRTLILFDGHRVPDTAQAGGVDVNTIPQFLLERVDVVTGGASAVYGSDAVSGVVNFIVDKNFKGIKLQAEAGVAQRGDNGSQKLGVGYGTDIGERGHLLLSYNYVNSEGIDSKTARRNGALVPNLTGAGTAANPFVPVLNARLATASVGGVIRNGPQAGNQFGPGGVIIPFDPGTAAGGLRSGGDGFFFDTGFLAGLESHQGYGRFDYEVSDGIDAYVQGSYSRTTNDVPFVQQQFTNLTLRTDNPFLSPEAQAALSATGATTFTIGRVEPEYIRSLSRTTNHFINGGLRGEFGEGFNWDVSYTNARTKQRTAARFNINNERQSAALDAVQLGSGEIVCRITTVDPSRFPGCVPLNLLGAGSITQEALDYITDETAYSLVQKLDDISASLTGSLFSIGNAEPVKFAVNGEYRKTSLKLDSNAQPVAANCTNLPLNCNSNPALGAVTQLYRSNVVANARGKQEVYEAAAELNVPLLQDQSFANSLSVSGAARYTHYNTSGSAWTWKVGGDWKPFEDLRLRVTRSRDIRAPNLNELFAPRNASPSGFVDARTTSNGIVQFVTTGNLDLEPEKADTFTAGIVYQPNFIPRLTIAVDYYDIKIKDAIQQFSGISIDATCNATNDADPLCAQLIVRPTPTSYPTEIRSLPRNLASFRQSGVDVEINYTVPVGAGDVSLRAITTYVDRQTVQNTAGGATVEYAGTIGGGPNPPPATPRWRVATFLGYNDDNWSLNTLARYRSSLSYSKNPLLVFNVPKVKDVVFVDATVTRKVQAFGGQAEFYLSVQNLLDTEAPIFYPNIGAPGFAYPGVAGDDFIGRRFNVGFRGRF